MTQQTLPDLPRWETVPEDVHAAIAEVKQAIRDRMAAAGRTPEEAFAQVERSIRAEVEQIRAEVERGEQPWPEVDFADIQAGTVPGETIAKIKRRGCAVVHGTFDREQAEQWDRDIVSYVDENEFFENYRGPGDDFFDTVDSKPEIYPIYWSSAQMEARQHPRMAATQAFMNSFWHGEAEGRSWFDPSRDALYADRIRRRPPGTDSAGLGTHIDPGTFDLWMTGAYQQAFDALYRGEVEAYDPWDASYRTEGNQYPGTTMTSVFRTFQGWTALSDMEPDQGVLHTVPIPGAMAYLLLRPLLSDVPADDMCGVRVSRTFPINERWHPLLMEAVVPIPAVAPGDTVWWHCDMIHSVGAVTDQQGWGNVMYIPAAPWCAKNEAYARPQLAAFKAGLSAPDFPDEHYEADWDNRFHFDELNATGRRGFGLDD